jgi:methylmalonyl-CoA mutase N-terminal domain/subunit
VVGVNRFQLDEEEPYEPLQVDPAIEKTQAAKLAALRASRDHASVDAALNDVQAAARGTGNVLYPLKEALRQRATVGEACNALRDVWGSYEPTHLAHLEMVNNACRMIEQPVNCDSLVTTRSDTGTQPLRVKD